MNILIIEPYYTGSHAAWAEGLAKHSTHNVDILSLEGRYWKWRMHGGAVTLAKKFMAGNYDPHLILATDMLDLTTFLSLTRARTASIPTAIYFHENQLSYPWSPDDRDVIHKRDKHYGFINYSSALTADAVFFNSNYHMESFLGELSLLLKNFPDYNELETVETIRAKSSVLPLGMDLNQLDQFKPSINKNNTTCQEPLILWNHRWEFDKNPEDFFKALYILKEKGIDFKVAILGENFRKRPKEFAEAKKQLGDRIVQYGYAKDFSDYAVWLWKSDIMPVTSNQDFFGGSVVEAMYCNCFPILPKRLAYPEHIPPEKHENFFYSDFNDLVSRLEWAIKNITSIRRQKVSHFVHHYDWKALAPVYDKTMNIILEK